MTNYLSGEPPADDESTRIQHVDVNSVIKSTQFRVDGNGAEPNWPQKKDSSILTDVPRNFAMRLCAFEKVGLAAAHRKEMTYRFVLGGTRAFQFERRWS